MNIALVISFLLHALPMFHGIFTHNKMSKLREERNKKKLEEKVYIGYH